MQNQLNPGVDQSFLLGSSKNNFLVGTPDSDIIDGLAGNDRINGRSGSDLLLGRIGNDQLKGLGGKDTLKGSSGRDFLEGGLGNDHLIGGADLDTLLGQEGNDLLKGGDKNDSLEGGDGNDRLLGQDGVDILVGGLGEDQLTGGAGRDRFILSPSAGTDRILDFQIGIDQIGLDGLPFEDLAIESLGDDSAVIRVRKPGDPGDGQTLVEVLGVRPESLTPDQFFEVDSPEEDTTAPLVDLGLAEDSGVADDGTTNTPVITGQVTDESAIASFSAGLNGTPIEDFEDVIEFLSPEGTFTLDEETLATLNGGSPLEDEAYEIQAIAIDEFGNESDIASFTFTLDTQAPELSLESPLEGAELEEGDRVAGTVEDLGSGIAALTYQFNEEDSVEISVGGSGDFDQALELTGLVDGEQSLILTAIDVAGNEIVQTLTVSTGGVGGPDELFEVMPGEQLRIDLNTLFPDLDDAIFSLESEETPPEGRLNADGILTFAPTPEDVGSFSFAIAATDGNQEDSIEVQLNVVADPVDSTRISGVIQDTNEIALAGITVGVGGITTITDTNGAFILEFPGEIPGDTLRIEPGQRVDGVVYPSISEPLSLLLGNDPFTGVNNEIGRPIYLPALDIANGVEIDPAVDTTVTTENIPEASVFVQAGSLANQDGTPFTGELSITEVPRDLTPATLPNNLLPDLVVTIQPGEMVFNTPAPLSLPNMAGYAPGREVELWSINPNNGEFDNVGTGIVSADGSTIETTSGGIRNSSWHFFTPPAPSAQDPRTNPRNELNGCKDCKARGKKFSSEVEFHSGAVIETHDLVPYQSLNTSRGLTFTYDSLRADPRPIIHFGYQDTQADPNQRLVAELTIRRGDFEFQVPGFEGGMGLDGGEHFWTVPGGNIDAALQADLEALPSGQYEYELTSGLLQLNNETQIFSGSTESSTGNILHVNSVNSVFGSGWGLAGLQEIVENQDGSLLIIDGDGGELLFEVADPANPEAGYDSPAGDFSTLEKLADGTFQRTLTDQTVFSFNAENRLAEMRDRNGNTTAYEYNADGNINKIVDPVGLETVFTYQNGRVASINDPGDRVTSLSYDAEGNLTSITDPDGTQRQWRYDSQHHMIEEIDKRGNREQTFYGFAGRAERAIQKDGAEITVSPVQVQGLYATDETIDPMNAPTAFQLSEDATSTYTDANGNTVTHILDQMGQIISSSDEEGTLPSFVRDENNLITRQTDGRGNATGLTYDANGNLASLVDEFTSNSTLVSTSSGEIGSINNVSGEYISLGNGPVLLDIARSANSQLFGVGGGDLIRITLESNEFESVGNLGATLNALAFSNEELFGTGSSGFYTVDLTTGAASLIANIPDFSSSGDLVFDADREVFWATSSEGGTDSLFSFALDGSTVRVGAIGFSGVFGVSFDSQGNLIGYTANGQQIQIDRDTGAGTLLQTIENISGSIFGSAEVSIGANPTRYEYDDTFNQLTKITDELGHQTINEIDPSNGNILSSTQVIGEVGGNDDLITEFTYTDLGLVDLITDPLGRITDFDYNDQGLITSITYAKGTADEAIEQFEYDAAGNQTAIIDENGNRTEFAYDANSRLIQVTEADPDGEGDLESPVTVMTYDEAGNLVEVIDPRGNPLQYNYDVLDRQIELIGADPDGEGDEEAPVNVSEYDAFGNLISFTDGVGNQYEYRYDKRNRRVEEIDPEGGSTQFVYDDDDNVIEVIDPLGNSTDFVYDARDRLIQETNALDNSVLYTYDAVNNQTSITDENGNQTVLAYDDVNRLVTATDALDGVFTTAYDEAGNVISETDELGRVTTYDYDGRDRLSLVTDPLDGVVAYEYDDVGNLVGLMDELNRTTTYAYDALNRRIAISDPLDYTQRFAYDGNNNLIATTDALGRVTQFTYDNLDRRIETINPLGDVFRRTYDLANNVMQTVDELGRTSSFTYDGLNRQISATDPLNQTTEREYDAVGNLTKLTDALGQTTEYSYDVIDQQTSVTDALGNTTTSTYDLFGNLLSLTDASGNTTSYTYDALNRVLTDTNQLGDSQTFTYDAVGNQTERIDRNGRERTFIFDDLNRLTQENWIDNAGESIRSINYAYDAASQLIDTSDPDSQYQYTYDDAGRLISTSNSGTPDAPTVVFNYTYDDANNLLSVSDQINSEGAGVESFVYDDLNRVTQIAQTGNGVADKRVNMAYDAASQLVGIERFSDLAGTQAVAQTDYTYDEVGRLTNLGHQDGGSAIVNYDYAYDAANRITQIISPDGTSDFEYNDRNELTGAEYDFQTNEDYTYDETGNRTNPGYETGENNQVLNDGTFTYEYDGEGNRTKRTEISTGEVTEYIWDYRDRLTDIIVRDADGNIIQESGYTYDMDDRRIEKTVDPDGEGADAAITERYIHDGDELALVFDGEGNQTQRYFYGPQIDQVLAEETVAGDVRWALADHQGSVRDVVNNAGQVLNHVIYDSFGQITEQSNPTAFFRFGYTGREFDREIGQYYYRARYYDPAVGRFISEDPIGFSSQDTNLFRYVFNNPHNFTDPSGLFWNYVIGGGLGGGLDLGIQLIQNGGDFSKVNWWSVTSSIVSGAAGIGITAKAGTVAKTLLGRSLLSGAAGGTVDTLLKLGTNAIQGKCLNEGLLTSFLTGGFGGAGGEAIDAFLPGLLRRLPFEGNLGKNNQVFTNVATEFDPGGVGGGLSFVEFSPSNRILAQELQMSCGPACARQLLKDAGIELPESVVRDAANFDPVFGTSADNLVDALSDLYPDAFFRGGSVSPEAFDALNQTGPWIARVKPSTGPHFVIVDGVEGNLVRIRDPWGSSAPGIGEGIEGSLPIQEFLEHWGRGINQVVFRVK